MSKSAKDGPRRSLDDSIYTTADEEKFDSEDHGRNSWVLRFGVFAYASDGDFGSNVQ
jgi:hypothetical protein